MGELRRHTARLRRYAAIAIAALTLIGAAAPSAVAQETEQREYQIKAAFLYNFVKFIDWPAPAFADAASPIVIGISCPGSVDTQLGAIVKDRKVNGREVVVRNIVRAEDAATLQVLFICSANQARFTQLKAAIGGTAVVTVGESDGFLAAGGMINFVVVDDRIRFEINADVADRAGIKISAQLQKLALAVRKGM